MIDTEFFKEQLDADLAVITKELEKLGIQNPQVKGDWIALPDEASSEEADENILADRTEEWEERQATLVALEMQYNDIVRALGKIEKGTYGVCEIGGEEIEQERLNANPSARTCVAHMDQEQDLSA